MVVTIYGWLGIILPLADYVGVGTKNFPVFEILVVRFNYKGVVRNLPGLEVLVLLFKLWF